MENKVDAVITGGIAKEKSIPYSSVYYIKTNRTWRHVKAAAPENTDS